MRHPLRIAAFASAGLASCVAPPPIVPADPYPGASAPVARFTLLTTSELHLQSLDSLALSAADTIRTKWVDVVAPNKHLFGDVVRMAANAAPRDKSLTSSIQGLAVGIELLLIASRRVATEQSHKCDAAEARALEFAHKFEGYYSSRFGADGPARKAADHMWSERQAALTTAAEASLAAGGLGALEAILRQQLAECLLMTLPTGNAQINDSDPTDGGFDFTKSVDSVADSLAQVAEVLISARQR